MTRGIDYKCTRRSMDILTFLLGQRLLHCVVSVVVSRWGSLLGGSAPDYFTSEGKTGLDQLEDLLDEMTSQLQQGSGR